MAFERPSQRVFRIEEGDVGSNAFRDEYVRHLAARLAEAEWLLNHAITRETVEEWTRRRDAWLADSASAVQPERCCLDYPRCDCNSPPEPDNAPTLQPCGHPWKAQHDFKCILCSSPG